MEIKKHKTILLVEDDEAMAMLGELNIKDFGYAFITANTGEKAVEVALSNYSINLILMDINLGAGIDGTVAAKQILEKRNIPIVFLTSHSEEEYVDRVKEITRYGYVIKNSGNFVLRTSIEMAFELFDANQRTKEKELKLEKAQSYAHIGSWEWDIKNNHLEWSDEMYRIFDIDKESFSGLLEYVIEGTIHPDDRSKVEQSTLSVIKGNKPIPMEFRVIWKNKSIHTVWAEAGEMVFDDKGNPVLLTGFVQEITERKQVEEELHKYKNQLEELVKERTSELEKKIKEIEHLNKLFVGREITMIELKKKIKELESIQ